jgi:hypothetical protein
VWVGTKVGGVTGSIGVAVAGSPSGVPPSAHATKVAISSSLNRRSPTRSPQLGSGIHGGIWRASIASRASGAAKRRLANVSSVNGPMPPSTWQVRQWRATIGATSWW